MPVGMPREEFSAGNMVYVDAGRHEIPDEYGNGPFEIEIIIPVEDLKNIQKYITTGKKYEPIDEYGDRTYALENLIKMTLQERLFWTNHHQLAILKNVYQSNGSVVIFTCYHLKKAA
jgi:hypothetical protein